jgi:hypothetical protein
MEWIKVRLKTDPAETLNVADELFPGLLTSEFWLMAASGRMVLVESVISECEWPNLTGDDKPKLISFLEGHSPKLAEKIEYYEA